MSSNPKYLGPGYWASWHLKAINSNSKEKKGELARNIALDIKYFPCDKCHKHARRYVLTNPLMAAVKDKDPLSMFKWTVNFHNEVNLRLGKKIFTPDEALAMWTGEKFCTENCSDEEEIDTPVPSPVVEKQDPIPEVTPDSPIEDEVDLDTLIIKNY